MLNPRTVRAQPLEGTTVGCLWLHARGRSISYGGLADICERPLRAWLERDAVQTRPEGSVLGLLRSWFLTNQFWLFAGRIRRAETARWIATSSTGIAISRASQG
ncbi:hypothetical protein GCM10010171_22680 [Actinokineospora fastidiosa]|uniref:Uncharacterized protein n=1 Tax=Actinokineospora fastidiosa TaxID=1816 RepID=A0A918GCR6_9PSEU|nr:hypothetical protein GCM10010171_22680 [Actinokineospora fastidiosa]